MRCYNENKNFYYMTQIFIYLLFFFSLEGLTICRRRSLVFSFSFRPKQQRTIYRGSERESKLPSLDSLFSILFFSCGKVRVTFWSTVKILSKVSFDISIVFSFYSTVKMLSIISFEISILFLESEKSWLKRINEIVDDWNVCFSISI